MQRKATKQSRSANADEKRHMSWLKERGICSACGNDGGFGGVILHHFLGSSYRKNGVTLGHWAILGFCQSCDNLRTQRGRKTFEEAYGEEAGLWMLQVEKYPQIDIVPQDVYENIVMI